MRTETSALQASPKPETGLYSFTIYTRDSRMRLGRVGRRGMKANTLGRLVETHWHNLPRIFPHVRLDTFILMPDRIHGIIEIETAHEHGIAAILRTFKSFSAREINKLQQTPGNMIWQQNHDERVLQDTVALEKARIDITDRPAQWQENCRHRLNPVSRQRTGFSLNWLLPSFTAAGH